MVLLQRRKEDSLLKENVAQTFSFGFFISLNKQKIIL